MKSTRTQAPPFQVYTLQDAAGQPKKRFTGQHLAHVSTGEHRNLPRWLTLDLFRKEDSTYILHRIGFSVVYHKLKGECEGGEELSYTELVDLVDGGEMCRKCNPRPFHDIQDVVRSGGDVDGGKAVRLEHNYYKVMELATVPAVIKALEFVPKNSEDGKRVISRPGQELLYRASRYDDAIAALDEQVQDI